MFDRGRIPSLFAWRSGAREEFEVKDKSVAFAASGGDRHRASKDARLNRRAMAIILEFEFLSRIIASMQSMKSCRHERRRPHMRSNQASTGANRPLLGSATSMALFSPADQAPSIIV
jgi:hypothetical protein